MQSSVFPAVYYKKSILYFYLSCFKKCTQIMYFAALLQFLFLKTLKNLTLKIVATGSSIKLFQTYSVRSISTFLISSPAKMWKITVILYFSLTVKLYHLRNVVMPLCFCNCKKMVLAKYYVILQLASILTQHNF